MKCHTCGCEKIEALVSCYWCEDPVIKDALPLGDPRLMGSGRPLSEARPEMGRVLVRVKGGYATLEFVAHWIEHLGRWSEGSDPDTYPCFTIDEEDAKDTVFWELPPVEEVG